MGGIADDNSPEALYEKWITNSIETLRNRGGRFARGDVERLVGDSMPVVDVPTMHRVCNMVLRDLDGRHDQAGLDAFIDVILPFLAQN